MATEQHRTLVDLSQPLGAGMPVYPGDPAVRVEPALTIEHDHVSVHALHLGTHTGTHLDAPAHLVQGGRTVDQVRLEEVTGPTLVLRAYGVGDNGLVHSLGDLPDEVPPRVFVATGWDRHWGTPRMAAHPGLSPDLVDALWRRGMRLLGTDCLSPDPTGGDGLPVHELVLGRDGLIVENLRGITALAGQVIDAHVVPLSWTGLDGSPVRAWARVP